MCVTSHIVYELSHFCVTSLQNTHELLMRWKMKLTFVLNVLSEIAWFGHFPKKQIPKLTQMSPGVVLISTCIHPALFPRLLVPRHILPMFNLSRAKTNAEGIPCLG